MSDQECEVRERLRARGLTPGTRPRLECTRLVGRGLTVPKVADLLECNDVTVRGAVHRFAARGLDALTDAPRPGRLGHP
ncbi:helix-turn-helix domain-containing protein [Streptomyces griseoluteus]